MTREHSQAGGRARRGLGRGLGALIPDLAPAVQEVDIDLASPRDPTNADFVELTKHVESLLDEEVKASRRIEA